MKRIILLWCFLLSLSGSVAIAQTTAPKLQKDTIEILSPWDETAPGKFKHNPEKGRRNCFDLIRFAFNCFAKDTVSIDFGDRIAKHISLFKLTGGVESRARIVEIGQYTWTDKFMVPWVEPWPTLAPGERRTIHVNASGGSGAQGAPGAPGKGAARAVAGMNGDGTYRVIPSEKKTKPATGGDPFIPGKDYANASLTEQVGSTVAGRDGNTRNDPYTPYAEAKLGYMYVVRVVNETNDYYVLLRIDDLVPGVKAVVSYWKLDLPLIP